MEKITERAKKRIVNMELSTFDIPPSGEILVLAKKCPIGPQAAKRMLDSALPDQFELIEVSDNLIECMLVKKYLFLRAEKKSLINAILEEAKAIMGPQCMLSIKCEIIVITRKEI